MGKIFRASSIFAIASAIISGLGGCAGYDVELKGGLFELAGMTNIGGNTVEPKMQKRNTLVVPPTTASLPVPGNGEPQSPQMISAANGMSWPIDPQKTRQQKQAALVSQHKLFCENARRRYKIGIDSILAKGPLGSCDESILRNLTGKALYEKRNGEKVQ